MATHLKKSIILMLSCLALTTARAQSIALSPEMIQLLVPSQVKGFIHDNDVKGKLMQVGKLQYSLCEHQFSKGDQKIKVLLFDFAEAPIMYNQATKEWKNYPTIISDSVTLRLVSMANCTGWESYHRISNTSKIHLGICDRFFLSITGEGVDLETLKIVLDQFRFDNFPK